MAEQIGGGTGWNIEAMNRFVNVPEYFSSVYLVDFSPSLCEVATRRFSRLGWANVKVVCEDARRFRLEDHERSPGGSEPSGADLLTMSYSLSMIVSLQLSGNGVMPSLQLRALVLMPI